MKKYRFILLNVINRKTSCKFDNVSSVGEAVNHSKRYMLDYGYESAKLAIINNQSGNITVKNITI